MKPTNVKSNTFNTLAPRGRGCPVGVGEGVSPMACVSPSSVLRTSSPSRGEVNSGFTLIELLVVVLIIGILTAVAVPQYQKAVLKSRFATVKEMARSLANAEEVYYLANDEYTEDFESLDVNTPTATSTGSDSFGKIRYFSWGSCRLDGSSGNGHLDCSLTKQQKPYMRYQIMLKHANWAPNQHMCVVYDEDLKNPGNLICQQETNSTTPFGMGKDSEGNFILWKY